MPWDCDGAMDTRQASTVLFIFADFRPQVMSNLAKTLWLSAIAAICAMGLFLANPGRNKTAKKEFVVAPPKLSLALLETKLRAVYPDFRGIRSVQIGLAKTTSSSSVELRITDSSRNTYACVAAHTSAGWVIEQIWRVKVAPAGRLI
jgi:hypothetical protein